MFRRGLSVSGHEIRAWEKAVQELGKSKYCDIKTKSVNLPDLNSFRYQKLR